MRKIAFFILVIGALVTGGAGLANLSRPLTATGAGLLGWALSPYLFLFLLLGSRHGRVPVVMASLLAIAVAVFGLAMVLDGLYVHPDPQSGMVFVVAPLWQWAGLLLGGIYHQLAGRLAARRAAARGNREAGGE